jgi:hypothetical protein
MKAWVCVWCLLAPSACVQVQAAVWQPSAGHVQTPIWALRTAPDPDDPT